MRALWWFIVLVILAGATLWFIHGGRIDPDCMSQPERMVRTAQGEATCVKKFP